MITRQELQAEAFRLLEEAKKNQNYNLSNKAAGQIELAHGYAHLASTMDPSDRFNGFIDE